MSDPQGDEAKAQKRRVEDFEEKLAWTAFEQANKLGSDHRSSIDKFAIDGLKTLQLLHAGGLTVLFASYSVFSRSSEFRIDSLYGPFYAFSLGLVCAMIAWFGAYFSQVYFADTVDSWGRRFNEKPFVYDTPKSLMNASWGKFWRHVALVAATASGLVFILGVALTGSAIRSS